MRAQFAILSALFITSPAFALCVVADVTTLREGPGTNFKSSLTVGKYTPLVELNSSHGWFEVADLDGEKHWVYGGVVSQKMKCLAVKSRKAALRSGPGYNYETTSYKTADRYTPFKRITTKGSWYNVIDSSGNRFWVSEDDIWKPVKVANISF